MTNTSGPAENQPPTVDLRALPPTIDVETAADILGIGRTLAYQLAKTGEFPCRIIKAGRRYRVPTAELRRVLGAEVDANGRD
jgi:excisionase family DNA binding protein